MKKLICLTLCFASAAAAVAGADSPKSDPEALKELRARVNVARKHENYKEDKIPPYVLPDPCTFADGRKLRDKSEWPARRREILDIFAKEMYGAEPPKPEAVVVETVEKGETLAGLGIRHQIRMWFKADKSGSAVEWLIIRPKHAKGPVPAFVILNYGGNQEFLEDEEIVMPTMMWPDGTEHPADPASRGALRRTRTNTSPLPIEIILARGYAVMTASFRNVSPDPNWLEIAELEAASVKGIFSLWGPRDPKRTDLTGSLSAWAWTMSRAVDYIETDPALDAKRVIAYGCSRLAKTALLAAARDERFAVCIPNQTGGCGLPLSKRWFGESPEISFLKFRHWYCAAYGKYGDREATVRGMPFDQHLLVAAIAPRRILGQGYPGAKFDAKGEFLSLKAASPAWALFGLKGLPDVDFPDYFDTSAIGDYVGYVRRTGDHGISGYDWQWALDFADRAFGK